MPQNPALSAFSAVYAFGDSLSDAGNLSVLTSTTGTPRPVSPPYYKQQYGPIGGTVFSNGPTWVQNLSIALSLGTLAPSLAGGTDFAYGGAETGSTPQNSGSSAIQAISLPGQLGQFQTRVPSPSANALYTVSIGSNDLLDILANPSLTAQQQTADVNAAVANEVSFVQTLIKDGAKTLLVLDVPDLSKTPDVTSGLANGSKVPSAALAAEAAQITSAYNTALSSQLATIASAGAVRIQVVDVNALLNTAIANPAVYGLTNVTAPVWSGNNTSASSGTLAVSGTAAQDQYLFWDALHPTETGHQAIADLAEQQLGGTPVLVVGDTTTGRPVVAQGQPYPGPVSGLQQQYINITPNSLNIIASTPNWFVHSGGGEDAIAVSSGTNVLDGGAGSNFLTGGSGTDTFFVDERGATAATWSTVVNFHAADAVTLWGVTQSDFLFGWSDGAGAVGSTGLTLTLQSAGKPETLLTLAGFTQADLTNGRLAVSFGTDAGSGSAYMNIHANA
jgi:phospholipase/lecithinase/hemolysin